MTTLADVADALYAGDPADFVLARDAAAKAARAAGDRTLSAAIKKMRRPSVAAWYVNVAARSSLVSLREWLALGASLREAQAALDGGRVRALGAGRPSLENRVIRDLTAHLSTLGIPVSASATDEVRATLRAALADAAAAEAVAAGRLERALSYGGFGEVDLSTALAAMTATREPDSARERDAEADTQAAAKARADVEADPDAGGEAEEGLGARTSGLRNRWPPPPTEPDPALVTAVANATRRLADADGVRRHAEEAVARAEGALAVAQRQLREAKAALSAAKERAEAAAGSMASAQTALDDAATS